MFQVPRAAIRITSSVALAFCLSNSATSTFGETLEGSCVDSSSMKMSSDKDDTLSVQRAVDSGRCVHLSTANQELVITSDIVLRKPSQTIYGDGRLTTRLRSGDPRGFKTGMFVTASGEPGPILRDFGVFYNQPDTANPKALIKYPPAFAFNATPRFRIEHLGCYLASICIEAKANSGGAIVQDLQLTAFDSGIEFDDAFDSIRLENVHWGPFYLTDRQRFVFLTSSIGHAVGIRLGRVDDFHVVDGTFYGGLGMEIRPSAKDGSAGFGSVRGCDFDNYSGLAIYGVGSVNIVGNEFTLGDGDTSLLMNGGIASVVGNKFLLAKPGFPVVLGGGSMTMVGNTFASGIVDATLVSQRGAETRLILNANLVEKDADRDYIRPIFDLRRGTTVAMGNVVSPLGAARHGVAFALDHDASANRFIGNSTPGWLNHWPQKPSGIYRDD